MKIIWHWLILSIAIFVTTLVLPNTIRVYPTYIILIVGACLMFVNFVIKPIISLLTLPINILTLGIFGIILNGAFFWLLADVIPGFHIVSFGGGSDWCAHCLDRQLDPRANLLI